MLEGDWLERQLDFNWRHPDRFSLLDCGRHVLPQATRAMSRDWEERWWAWARASWDRATDDNSGEVAFNILKEIWQNKRAVKEHHGISGF